MLLKILEPITVFSENENRHFKVNVEINKIFRSFVSSFMCTEKREKTEISVHFNGAENLTK